MYRDDYLAIQVVAWWGALVLITFCINFLIYIINKDNRFFVGLLVLLSATIALDKYTAINLGEMAGTVFDQVVETPVLFGAFLIPAFLSYGMVYLFFKTRPLYGCRVQTKKDTSSRRRICVFKRFW